MKTSRAKILCVIMVAASLFSCNQPPDQPISESTTPVAREAVIPTTTPSPAVERPDSREIGPGLVKDSSGKTHQTTGDLNFIVLDTNKWGQAMVGSWPNLQPKIHDMLTKEKQNFWDGASITFLGEDFIKFTPKTPLESSMVKESSIAVVPVEGLAYISETGAILISLSNAQAPAGFHLLGQASIKVSVLERWSKNKEGLTVRWATDLRI